MTKKYLTHFTWECVECGEVGYGFVLKPYCAKCFRKVFYKQ